MAQLHNAITSGELTRALKAILGDTKPAGGLERFGETLTPIVDLWARPEFALLRNEELFAISSTQNAGAAGTFAKVGIFNPVGSRLLVVVLLHALIPAVAATTIDLFPLAAVLGNTQTVRTLDRRSTLSHGAVSHFEASAAAGGDLMASLQFNVNPPLYHAIPLVLPPGQGFMWRTQDDAAGLTANFIGYQRIAKKGELFS